MATAMTAGLAQDGRVPDEGLSIQVEGGRIEIRKSRCNYSSPITGSYTSAYGPIEVSPGVAHA